MSTTTTAVIPAQRRGGRLTKAQQAKIRLAAVRAAVELPPIDDDWLHMERIAEQADRYAGED